MIADLNTTGHCSAGRHHRCSHRTGGPAEGGITSSVDGTVYRCPCSCHQPEPTLF